LSLVVVRAMPTDDGFPVRVAVCSSNIVGTDREGDIRYPWGL